MKIVVVGTGYVGLVSGACFADFGHDVVCIDTDGAKIQRLQGGEIPIYEPGLADLVQRTVAAGRLGFTTDLAGPVRAADVVMIAVGTPSRAGDGFADLSFIYAAARSIAAHLEPARHTVVVVKSTVPVGLCDRIEVILAETVPKSAFSVVSNPEFLREGVAIDDFVRPDRVVVGTARGDTRAIEAMAAIYRPLSQADVPILFTDRRTSELIKYAANAFLATKITFINEIADVCEKVGADIQDVAHGMGLDNRIGPKFLNAGPGWGGSCFPKDTLALVKTAQDVDVPSRIIETVAAVNDQRKRAMARKVIAACGGSVRDKTIAILGLTFKPNTDDMREAPSLAIVTALEDAGARICAYDPEGMAQARPLLPNVQFAANAYACITGADAMVIVTEWNEFRALDLERVKALLAKPIIVDLRNIYRAEDLAGLGFSYTSVGRSTRPA